MKTISILLLVLFHSIYLNAQESLSSIKDWQEITDDLRRNDKFLLAIFLDKNYNESVSEFIKPEIQDKINNRFILRKLDVNDSLGVILSKKFRIDNTPTLLVFNNYGDYVSRYSYGTFSSKIMKRFLDEIIETSNKKEFHYNSRDLNIIYPDFYDEYFNQTSIERRAPTDSVINSYLDNQEDLYSEINWSVIMVFEPDKYRNFVINNLEEYLDRYGVGELSIFLIPQVFDYLDKSIDYAKNKYYDTTYMVASYCQFPDILKTGLDFIYFEEANDWSSFDETLESTITFFPYDEINEYCYTIYENVNDSTILNKAIEWMKPVIKNDPTYDNLDTYAALLYKTDNLEKALLYANKAIDAAINDKISDFSTTTELQEKILNKSYGQENMNQEYDQEVKEYLKVVLYGKWIAHCPFERSSKSSISISRLCPIVFSNDSSIMTTDIFEMEITENYISFYIYDSIIDKCTTEHIQRSIKTSTAYQYDYYTNEIEFSLFDHDFVFKVVYLGFYANHNIILKEDDCSIVYLERIPSRDYYHSLEK